MTFASRWLTKKLMAVEKKLRRHRDFWDRTNREPLLGFTIGDYFVSRRFRAASQILATKDPIGPEMLRVDEFREDYLRMHEETESVEQDIFFTGTPFTGIPWMEAMLGCEVYATGHSFVAQGPGGQAEGLSPEARFCQPWLDRYLEFTRMLTEVGEGRFPVGQPIMRGPTDIVGTLLGQERLVYEIYDHPDEVRRLLRESAEIFLSVIREQKRLIDGFHGGSSMGFYDLWCPGDSIWYQDDLNALLSPEIYDEIVYPVHRMIPKDYEYSLFHLHPASFFILDSLLTIEDLKVVQINKDEGGPSVAEMMPVFRKVQEKKNLALWGSFSPEEVTLISEQLPPEGVYVMVAIETPEESVNYLR